MISVIFSNNSH